MPSRSNARSPNPRQVAWVFATVGLRLQVKWSAEAGRTVASMNNPAIEAHLSQFIVTSQTSTVIDAAVCNRQGRRDRLRCQGPGRPQDAVRPSATGWPRV